MCIGNSKQVCCDTRLNFIEYLPCQRDVCGFLTDVFAAIPLQETLCDRRLAFDKTTIQRHKPAAKFQSSLCHPEQVHGLSICQVVQHTGGKHEIKAGVFSHQLSAYHFDVELAA